MARVRIQEAEFQSSENVELDISSLHVEPAARLPRSSMLMRNRRETMIEIMVWEQQEKPMSVILWMESNK